MCGGMNLPSSSTIWACRRSGDRGQRAAPPLPRHVGAYGPPGAWCGIPRAASVRAADPEAEQPSQRQPPVGMYLEDARRLERPRRVGASAWPHVRAVAHERRRDADPGGDDHDAAACEQLEVDAHSSAVRPAAETGDGPSFEDVAGRGRWMEPRAGADWRRRVALGPLGGCRGGERNPQEREDCAH